MVGTSMCSRWLSTVVLAFAVSGCVSTNGAGRQLRQADPAYAPPPARVPGPVRMGNTILMSLERLLTDIVTIYARQNRGQKK